MLRGGGGGDGLRAEGWQDGWLPPSSAHALDYYVPRKPPAARWVRGSPWADVGPPEVVKRGAEGGVGGWVVVGWPFAAISIPGDAGPVGGWAVLTRR